MLRDKVMNLKIKGNVYRRVLKPALVCKAETWTRSMIGLCSFRGVCVSGYSLFSVAAFAIRIYNHFLILLFLSMYIQVTCSSS